MLKLDKNRQCLISSEQSEKIANAFDNNLYNKLFNAVGIKRPSEYKQRRGAFVKNLCISLGATTGQKSVRSDGSIKKMMLIDFSEVEAAYLKMKNDKASKSQKESDKFSWMKKEKEDDMTGVYFGNPDVFLDEDKGTVHISVTCRGAKGKINRAYGLSALDSVFDLFNPHAKNIECETDREKVHLLNFCAPPVRVESGVLMELAF
jgi:hypothetical protein